MLKTIKPCTDMFSAVVPVAGLSLRAGVFKPLVKINGECLIHRTLKSLFDGGTDNAVVVTGFRSEDVKNAISDFSDRIIVIENKDYDKTDMFFSVKKGISVLPECKGFFILPGDMPDVDFHTVALLIEKFNLLINSSSGSLLDSSLSSQLGLQDFVIFPSFCGKRGHPPLISYSLKDRIIKYEGECGLRGFWSEVKDNLINISVEDRGIIIDIDRISDLAKMK